ncbi:GNAT family N-acetyltransferase [Marinomonas colpomeniae]|uniref:GNAT family N-acetyltransferase n=1 Tax=Marinomonas colpomeniae TaxID=2774408 RepID=A0ABR8NX44_9GAMM|nr:GNAT family N-acetyltransferase [Marinomonas colpomeniae]MBD5769637.1 GNAT family N-acetyltransferase [Marinomonas colpomeniae]
MFEKIVLQGKYVRLEPLSENHREGLCQAASDGKLWELFFTFVPHPDDIDEFFNKAYEIHKNGAGLTFVTIDEATDKVIGSTRFMNANLANKAVEIGSTFLAKSHQQTKANTEAKLLMLNHAFEVLNLNRVEFLTDYLNHRSRNAILRLGAKQEGVLRSHRVMPNGRIRDTVIFSILSHEWAGVKQHLEYKLC